MRKVPSVLLATLIALAVIGVIVGWGLLIAYVSVWILLVPVGMIMIGAFVVFILEGADAIDEYRENK